MNKDYVDKITSSKMASSDKMAAQDSITVSNSAIQHFKNTLQLNQEAKGIRLGVKKSGCSGLAYTVDFIKTTEKKNDDLHIEIEGVTIYIDNQSFPYLKGMHIECVNEGLNSYLKFKNPNVKGECGCGESFTTEDH